MSAPVYLIYRWVLAIFMSVSIILDRDYFGRWYSSYFTTWCLATITIYFTIYAILCSYLFYKTHRSGNISMTTENDSKDLEIQPIQNKEELHPGMVWGYKITWMLFNIAAVNSMIVTIGYWGLLYSYHGQRSLIGRLGYHNITSHLLNALLMLLDAMIAPLPVRILHVVYSNLYVLLYISATVIHWLISNKTKKFYYFLDYSNKPVVAVLVIVLGCIVVQPLLQFFFYGIYRLREWLLTKISRDQQTGAQMVHSIETQSNPEC